LYIPNILLLLFKIIFMKDFYGKFPTKSVQAFLPVNVDMFIEKIKVDLFDGVMSEVQIESVKAIMNQCLVQGMYDIRMVAYAYASAYYDCYQPNSPSPARLVPCFEHHALVILKTNLYFPYFGRSYPQLRYKHHYKAESIRQNIDLLYSPDLMMQIEISANTHVHYLLHGLHWGRKLGDYIYGNYCNYTKCRRCTSNSNNRWEVARIAFIFEKSLRESLI